jgi:hypothetical protein
MTAEEPKEGRACALPSTLPKGYDSMSEQIEVLIIEPRRKPRRASIGNDLKSMQAIVGGYIQCVYPFPDKVVLVCDDEGKFNGKPLNRSLFHSDTHELYDIIAGNFIVASFVDADGKDDGDFHSLTPEQFATYSAFYAMPEMFMRIGERIIALPYTEEDISSGELSKNG